MLSEEEIEKAKEETKKWIYNMRTGRRVNIIHKGDKDFCNDLETLLQYIEELETANNELDRDKRTCFYEDGNTGKCLGYSSINDDESCEYCKTCEALGVKGDD